MTVRVLLADDEPLVRAGIGMLLAADLDIEVVGEVGDGQAAVEGVRSSRPDVVVMDLRMPGMDGVEATRRIVESCAGSGDRALEHVSVLVLTTYNIDEAVYAALRAGASGFLLKDAAPAELIAAIKAVAEGKGWLDPAVTRSLIKEFAARSEGVVGSPVVSRSLWEAPEREILVTLGGSQGSQGSRGQGGAGVPPGHAVFKKEGEYWTIAFEGRLFRLKDSVGMHYLARMLQEPGREFHALDLVRSPRPPSARDGLGLGHAGELLDDRAKALYRHRMAELRNDLEEADSWGDAERASKAREVLEILAEEFARGVGLGGRDRVAASDAERARVNVTKAIKATIKRIRHDHPSLARHLNFSVRTGTFCSYSPEAPAAVIWHV